jgi:signal transduction histidine kinase
LKKLFNNVLRKNFYLLLAATWLVTISFIIHYWSQYHSSTQRFAEKIQIELQEKEKDFLAFSNNAPLIARLSNRLFTEEELTAIITKPYHVFLYRYDSNENLQLVFWNTQSVQPDWQMLYADESRLLMNYYNGDYEQIRKTVSSGGHKIVVIGLIPLKHEYFLENEYMRNDFVDAPGGNYRKLYEITAEKGDEPVLSIFGKTLFYISKKSGIIQQDESTAALLFRLAGIFFLLIWLHGIVLSIEEIYGRFAALSVLGFVLAGIRTLIFFKIFPFHFRQYGLFDPSIYSSGPLFPSLGDFMINMLALLWLLSYANRLFVAEQDKQGSFKMGGSILAIISAAVLFCIISFFCSYLVSTLVSDSKISYNVNNIYSLDLYSFIGFFIMGLISLVFFYGVRLVFYLFKPYILYGGIYFFLAVAICGLAYLSFRTSLAIAQQELYLLCWLIGFLLINVIFKTLSVDKVKSLSGYLFWVFIFSGTLSAIVLRENTKASLKQKQFLAENLALQADPENEALLNIAFSNFSSFFFQNNFNRFRNDSVAAFIKDSLVKDIFKGYLNKYDTRIYVYDGGGKPLKGYEEASFDTLNTILTNQARHTKIPGLMYYESSFDQYAYLSKKEIRDTSGSLMGYVFIQSSPKRYKSDALYPELFRQRGQALQDKASAYTYAIYERMELRQHNNDYPFPTYLTRDELPKTLFEVREKGAYTELWHKAANNKIVIIVEPDTGLMNWVSLFAYLFCAFLITLLVVYLVFALFRTRFRWVEFKRYLQLSIRTQIQGTIIVANLVSFTVIGIVAVNFFTARYERNNRERLSKTINIMNEQMQNELTRKIVHDDSARLYDEFVNMELERKISSISEIYNVDVNLYDPEGNLKVTSQPFIYNRGILSEKMNPHAYYHLKEKRELQFIQKEKIGYLEYTSIYVPVRDDKGNMLALLNIPYFSSQSELKQEISNFLVTIINLNAFIFLIAGAFAFFITNRITDSFSIIGEKMKAVNLGKVNEEIVWNNDDEIGELVKEYNKMVHQLEKSAEVLAKTEREGAWREMARQVAHEIKNPLTPMKLSIQYLQKSLNEDPSKVKELSASVARTLVEQIDHLSKIAADFSQFANIGNPKNERFDLHDVLSSLSNLYATSQGLKFEWRPVHQQVIINADKTQINRLFTNLLQNAVQAMPEDWNGLVVIQEELKDGQILVSVTDNGIGIPEEVRAKIFTPNFTTKSSGTGLGLAMSKGIVEQSGGNMWFDTEIGKGTTFYVLLPLA